MTKPDVPWGPEAVELPYPPKGEPEEGTILHVRTGRTLSEEDLIDLAADARVVYVSEAHDNPAAHRIQARLLRGLAERFPGSVVLGMEMFPYTAQDALGAFNRGEMSDREFRHLWSKHWNIDIEYYKPLLDVVRELSIPIVGLNVPNEVIKKISREGVSALSDDERSKLPENGPADPYQRTFLEAIFSGHNMGSGMIDRFVTIQNLWEESMAARAADYLTGAEGAGKRMVIVAGGHHIDYGFGIPRRLFRRLPVSYLTIMPRLVNLEAVDKERLMDVETPDLPLLPADIYWFVRYENIPKRPKLGVAVSTDERGLRISHVFPGSAAEAAGLLKDDVLTAMDGTPLKEPFDLIDQIRTKKPGDRAVIEYLRGDDSATVEATFPEPAANHPKKP